MNQVLTASPVRDVLQRHGLPSLPWYAVLDAAIDATAPRLAADAGLRTQSLYAGELGAMLDHVAPHLSTFNLASPFAEWLLERWGGNHGILLQAPGNFDEVRRHLRTLLMVKDEAGKKFRLRFYDPRVLRGFLPACTPEEQVTVMGPIPAWYASSRYADAVWSFVMTPRGMTAKELPLGPRAGGK